MASLRPTESPCSYESWCGGDSALAKAGVTGRSRLPWSFQNGEGRRCDDSGPFAALQQAQSLRLCTQEAQTIACWRIFGQTPGLRRLRPMMPHATRDAQCIGEEQGHARLVFEHQIRHQQPVARRNLLAGRRAAQLAGSKQVICMGRLRHARVAQRGVGWRQSRKSGTANGEAK